MSETDWGQWMADSNEEQVSSQNEENIDNSDPSSTTINDLGEYELIKIFAYFPFKKRVVLSWVCLKWRHCVEKSFKSETVFDNKCVGLNSRFKSICPLLQKCSNVRHISLIGIIFTPIDSSEEVDTLLTTIVTNCSQLQSIDFGSVHVLDEVFKKNADYFLRLKKITSSAIGEEALNCIIGSQHLETIDITRTDSISKLDFKRLGPKIRELHLIESEVSKPIVINDLCEGNGKRIEVLSIDIKDKEVLSLICDNLKKLKELKLCLYSENCDFKGFANLNDLKSLQIVAKDSIFKSKEFSDLIRSLKGTKINELRVHLSSMNNIAVTDDSLQEIRQSCPFIEKLVIKGANSLTGTGMYSISQMKHLKHLNLKNCFNISDQIEIVITSCPLLRELIVHSCSHITNVTVDSFIEKSKAFPTEQFLLDVIDTSILPESLPLYEEWPKNLIILYDTDSCDYSSCEHGWGPDGYHSGPEDNWGDYNDNMEDVDDFYAADDDNDFYDEYGDEDIDYEFS